MVHLLVKKSKKVIYLIRKIKTHTQKTMRKVWHYSWWQSFRWYSDARW